MNDDKKKEAEAEFSSFVDLHAPVLEERVRVALFDYFLENPTDYIELELYMLQSIASFINTYTECVLKFEEIPNNIIKEAQKYGKGVAMKKFEIEKENINDADHLITMGGGDA